MIIRFFKIILAIIFIVLFTIYLILGFVLVVMLIFIIGLPMNIRMGHLINKYEKAFISEPKKLNALTKRLAFFNTGLLIITNITDLYSDSISGGITYLKDRLLTSPKLQ